MPMPSAAVRTGDPSLDGSLHLL